MHQGDLSLSAGPMKIFWTQHFFDRNTVSYEATVQSLFFKGKISDLKHYLHFFIINLKKVLLKTYFMKFALQIVHARLSTL